MMYTVQPNMGNWDNAVKVVLIQSAHLLLSFDDLCQLDEARLVANA